MSSAAYREANREKIREAQRAWYQANREKVLANVSAYQSLHAERYLEYQRKYRSDESNRARERERRRAYREANADALKAKRVADTKRRQQWWRAWYEANQDHIREYRKTHAQEARDRCARRRARIKGAPIVEKVDRDAIIKRDHGVCHICGDPTPVDEIELDHIVPLARGGSHTASNLAVAHRSCNRRKGALVTGQVS